LENPGEIKFSHKEKNFSQKLEKKFTFANSTVKTFARVAELVDALVSKTNEGDLVPVRSRPRVPKRKRVFAKAKTLFLFLNTLAPTQTEQGIKQKLSFFFSTLLLQLKLSKASSKNSLSFSQYSCSNSNCAKHQAKTLFLFLNTLAPTQTVQESVLSRE